MPSERGLLHCGPSTGVGAILLFFALPSLLSSLSLTPDASLLLPAMLLAVERGVSGGVETPATPAFPLPVMPTEPLTLAVTPGTLPETSCGLLITVPDGRCAIDA